MNFGKKRKDFQSKFALFDTHFKIERYTVYFLLMIVLFSSGIFVSKRHISNENYKVLMRVDTVGAASTFSRTSSTTLTLSSTSLSPDGKIAYIPVTFNSTDNVGIKADDYKIYIRSSDNKSMSNKLEGRFIMYGADNQALIVLSSDKPFESIPLDLFIMSLKNTKTLNDLAVDKSLSSSSSDAFGEFDVAAFKINPGSSNILKNERIKVDGYDIQTLYEKTFGSTDIANIYKQIDSNEKRIKEYEEVASALIERLELEGYIVPENPAWLSDDWKPYDFVDIESGKTATGEDALNYDVTSASNVDSDKDTIKFDETLENKNGKKMDSNSNVSANNSLTETNDDSSVTESDTTKLSPSEQWYNLRTAWLNIKKLKRKNMVDANIKIYEIRQKEKDVLDHATISSADKFKQISKVVSD